MGGGIEYAPGAIRDLFDAIRRALPAAQLSGIVGDASHTYGYHRARNVLPADDYSVTSPADRQGDGWAAAALDITLPADLMRTVSARLMAACKAGDPRVAALREWFGTLDGKRVTGWDRVEGGPTSSDDSHLWHVHLSIFRKFTNDVAALAPLVDVIAGRAAGDWFDMATVDELRGAVRAEVAELLNIARTGRSDGDRKVWPYPFTPVERILSILARPALTAADVSAAVKAALPAGPVDAEKVAAAVVSALGAKLADQ